MGNKEFVISLFNLLNENYNYAVLRSFEELPENFISHDVDILIDKKEFNLLKKDVCKIIKYFDYRLLMVNTNERFVTFIIAKQIGDELIYLYLDFFFNYSLYGVNLIDAHEVLEKRQFNGKVYHVNKVYEFLEKFLNTSLLNQGYPSKYSELLNEINENYSLEVNSRLSALFNIKALNIVDCEKNSGNYLLKKAFLRNLFSNPIKQVAFSTKFLCYHLKGKLKPNGFSFSITGPDGSGKTTILNGLEDKFSKVYREVEYNHFRPTVIPRIAELFKESGLKKDVDVNYDKPHRGEKTGILSSVFRIFYYIADYIIGYYKLVKPILVRRGVVIFDRYFTDIISDSKRSQINLNYKVLFFLRRLVPKMNYNFIIFVEPKIILERKKELTKIQIEDIYVKLNYICNKDNNYTPIENNKNVEVAINEIINFVLSNQNKKYNKFFK
ncbi:hypothetical protein ABXT64_06565 [Candidatus Marifrigoribacter sp. Uisw_064]|jgi:thymidylate kinase|uniref:hypothetical protein n=1 Tax=Candidatus Marifrigoribacter sp. Uisw_064 TaxID=3230970 RepID=UPI003D5848F8